jgi:hypothetical protein
VLTEARALPVSVDPPGDLWPAIERRLAPRGAGRTRRPDWRALAAAAVLALGFVAAGLVLRRDGTTGGARPVAAVDPAPATAPVAPARFDAAEEALLATKRQLREALARRRSDLSPSTAAAVDRNLELIERAIDEIRVALEEDPTNPRLNRMLLATHQREVALLQRVTHPGRRL